MSRHRARQGALRLIIVDQVDFGARMSFLTADHIKVTNSKKSVIPLVQTNTPTSPRSTGPISPLSPTPVMSGGRARSPSPPTPSYYMKAWQASEVAKSVATSSGPPLAVAQEPVRSQELPPRQKTRGDDVPPERPPKSRALFIEKL